MERTIKLTKFQDCKHSWSPINGRAAMFGYRCMGCLGWKDGITGKEMSWEDSAKFRRESIGLAD